MQFERAKVLVVDDTPSNCMLMEAALSRVNLEVILAEDGLEGIRIAKEAQPDLIFMDLLMPKCDGFEATKQIKADPAIQNIPVLALTAALTQETIARVNATGFDGYLPKPINFEQIYQTLSQFLKVKPVVGPNNLSPGPAAPLATVNIKEKSRFLSRVETEVLPVIQRNLKASDMHDLSNLIKLLGKLTQEHETDLLQEPLKQLGLAVQSYHLVEIKKYLRQVEEKINSIR